MARLPVTETERLVVSMVQAAVAQAASRHPGYLSRVLEVLSALSRGDIGDAIEVLERLREGYTT